MTTKSVSTGEALARLVEEPLTVEEAKEKLINAAWDSADAYSRRSQLADCIEALIRAVIAEKQ